MIVGSQWYQQSPYPFHILFKNGTHILIVVFFPMDNLPLRESIVNMLFIFGEPMGALKQIQDMVPVFWYKLLFVHGPWVHRHDDPRGCVWPLSSHVVAAFNSVTGTSFLNVEGETVHFYKFETFEIA